MPEIVARLLPQAQQTLYDNSRLSGGVVICFATHDSYSAIFNNRTCRPPGSVCGTEPVMSHIVVQMHSINKSNDDIHIEQAGHQ